MGNANEITDQNDAPKSGRKSGQNKDEPTGGFTTVRWRSVEEKAFVQQAADKDNRPLNNFILNATLLKAEDMLRVVDEDDDDDDDDEDYE